MSENVSSVAFIKGLSQKPNCGTNLSFHQQMNEKTKQNKTDIRVQWNSSQALKRREISIFNNMCRILDHRDE